MKPHPAIAVMLLALGCPDEKPTAETSMSDLEFFNDLSGRLQIELSEPTENVAPNLLNQKASPTARILSMKLEVEVYENDTFRPLTNEELNRVVLREAVIRLRGEVGEPVEHRAPNGVHFTVKDLVKALEETERRTRAKSEWIGGIDVHHVYFEGIEREADGTWSIAWGS